MESDGQRASTAPGGTRVSRVGNGAPVGAEGRRGGTEWRRKPEGGGATLPHGQAVAQRPSTLSEAAYEGKSALALEMRRRGIPEQRKAFGGFRKPRDEMASLNSLVIGANKERLTPESEDLKFKEVEEPLGAPMYVSIIDRMSFNLFVLVAVVVNTLTVGLQEELATDGAYDLGWNGFGCVCAICFCVELVARLCAHGRNYFLEVPNILDTLVIAGMVVDVFVLVPARAVPLAGTLRLASQLRLFRLLRLVRLLRMTRAFRELWLVVGGFMNSLKALGLVGLLLVGTLFVFGVLMTTEIGWNAEDYDNQTSWDGKIWPSRLYFGTMARSMFTLFQVMTLDGWCDSVLRHIVHQQPLLGLVVFFFVIITSFGLVNVFIGVMVESTLSAAVVADGRRGAIHYFDQCKNVDQIIDLLTMSDVQREGALSLEELTGAYKNPEIRGKFDFVEISSDEFEEVFAWLDTERKGVISLDEFKQALKALLSTGSSRDIVGVEITAGKLTHNLEDLERSFGEMDAKIRQFRAYADDFVQNTVSQLSNLDAMKTRAPLATRPPSSSCTSSNSG